MNRLPRPIQPSFSVQSRGFPPPEKNITRQKILEVLFILLSITNISSFATSTSRLSPRTVLFYCLQHSRPEGRNLYIHQRRAHHSSNHAHRPDVVVASVAGPPLFRQRAESFLWAPIEVNAAFTLRHASAMLGKGPEYGGANPARPLTSTPEYRRYNPTGLVPTLILEGEDGTPSQGIFESATIVRYLARAYDAHGAVFECSTPEEEARASLWMACWRSNSQRRHTRSCWGQGLPWPTSPLVAP